MKEKTLNEVAKDVAMAVDTNPDTNLKVIHSKGGALVLQDLETGATWSVVVSPYQMRLDNLREAERALKGISFGIIYGAPHDVEAAQHIMETRSSMRAEIDALNSQFGARSIKKARAFAIEAHGDQKYGDKRPYIDHLDAVANTLSRFGVSPIRHWEIHTAAYLHDILEDTKVTKEDLVDAFGHDIAVLVDRVTNEKGKNRKERHQKTYPKIRGDYQATVLKLADRISNVTECIKDLQQGKKSLFQMYLPEYTEMREMLHTPLNEWIRGTPVANAINEMWTELDRLMASCPKCGAAPGDACAEVHT